VVSVDLPGHGESGGEPCQSIHAYAEQLFAWMRARDLPPAALAGHSMGGGIALQLTLDHPDQVAALTLIGTGARLRVHPDLLAMAADRARFDAAVDLITGWAFSEKTPDRIVDLARARMREVPPEVLHADFLACDRFDVMSRLAEVSVPSLVLCGREDRMTPEKYSRFLAENLPGARLALIEGAGHMVMLERPRRVAMELNRFLEDYFGARETRSAS
jgi:pimeloyl-ACP methyl ester carboxylesterase